MDKKRVVSYSSEVYHRSGCYYIDRMLNQNKLHVTAADAIKHGCRGFIFPDQPDSPL